MIDITKKNTENTKCSRQNKKYITMESMVFFLVTDVNLLKDQLHYWRFVICDCLKKTYKERYPFTCKYMRIRNAYNVEHINIHVL